MFLGLSYDQDLQVEGSWDDVLVPDLSGLAAPTQFAELLVATSSVDAASDSLELQTIKYESFANIYGKVNKDYDQYKYDYDQAAKNHSDTLNQGWLSLYSDYYSLMEQERTYLEGLASLDYEEKMYGIQDLKYSLGESSLSSLLDAEQDLYGSTLQHNQQKLNLMLAVLDWQNQYE